VVINHLNGATAARAEGEAASSFNHSGADDTLSLLALDVAEQAGRRKRGF
jgi:hypothetical protein